MKTKAEMQAEIQDLRKQVVELRQEVEWAKSRAMEDAWGRWFTKACPGLEKWRRAMNLRGFLPPNGNIGIDQKRFKAAWVEAMNEARGQGRHGP